MLGEDALAGAGQDGKGKGGGKPTPPTVHVEYTFYPHHWARHTNTAGEGLTCLATSGHTIAHQSVLID